MPILKAINTGNGFSAACRVEEIVGKRNTLAEQGWAIQVGLYPDLESAREGRGLLWQLYPTLPYAAIDAADPYNSAELTLTQVEGDFYGGTFMPQEPTTSLDEAKAVKWAQIKTDRIRAEDAGFTVEGLGTFQSDNDSRQKITGAALAAKIAKDDGQPYQVNWTLADNSVIPLNADQMIEVGQALLVHLDEVHQRSLQLYTLVQSAETVEEVEAINWSTAA